MAKTAALPDHKTRIVATIGPASAARSVIADLLRAGMDVARINFSHGDFDAHARVIADLRAVEQETGRRLAIMADLPGPKMRIGTIAGEPVELRRGDGIHPDHARDRRRRRRGVGELRSACRRWSKPGDALFLNDGIIQLEVERVAGHGRPLPGGGRRRAALAQGSQPARHRPRHLGLHRARPRMPALRRSRTASTRSASRSSTRPPTSRRCAPRRPRTATTRS